jgi:hypothetical protein
VFAAAFHPGRHRSLAVNTGGAAFLLQLDGILKARQPGQLDTSGNRAGLSHWQRHQGCKGEQARRQAAGMFIVTEADAAAIRDIFNREGELSAAIELRRRFPGVTDNAKAREFVRTIAGWAPPPAPASVVQTRPRDPDPEG